jgi:hypothetical protein
LNFWKSHNIIPELLRMDNESSVDFEAALMITHPRLRIEYVPPTNHRANRAERAIRTWKNHFISGLATVDPSFPMEAWDELIPAAELTLNLLRGSSTVPNCSAWQHIHGFFNYDRHPLAPPGMKITCFESPESRSSWAGHGRLGYYLGPSLTHYRCHRVWISDTRSVRVSDTLAWHPRPEHLLPSASPVDDLVAGLQNLTTRLESLVKTHPLILDKQSISDNHMSLLNEAIPAISSLHNTSQLVPSPRVEDLPQESFTRELIIPPDTMVPIIEDYIGDQPPSDPMDLVHDPLEPSIQPRKRTRPRRYDDFEVSSARKTLTVAAAGVQDAFILNDNNKPLRYKDTKRGPDADLWRIAETEEFTRLIHDTGTMNFIDPKLKPGERTASYYNPQVTCKYKGGVLVRRVRGTYGGNINDYKGEKSASTADMQTFKLLVNSCVSDDCKLMTLDIKDFYLGTTLIRPEYMWIRKDQIPVDIQIRYASTIVWVGDRAMVKITQGIYGLPQAGRLAQEKLTDILANAGYIQSSTTPCLFRHISNSITFTLVVDDFAVKYKSKEDVHHLMAAVRKAYVLTEDWTGSRYLGMSISFKGTGASRHATLSMPGYVAAALKRFPTEMSRPVSSPATFTRQARGKVAAMAIIDNSPIITDSKTIKFIQEVIGVFLYYARAVDATMLTTLSKLASRQAHPTSDLVSSVHHFLQYAASNPTSEVVFYPSTMKLVTHSDASYNSEPNARSRAGGYFFLAREGYTDQVLATNGAIDVLCKIIPSVVASAAEAEYAALFLNGQQTLILSNTLKDMGYPQHCPFLVADNTTACGIATRSTKQKRSRAMDMRYHWVRDKVDNKDLAVVWREGKSNLADYFTKTHPPSHYVICRPIYAGQSSPELWLHITSSSKSPKQNVAHLQGCIDNDEQDSFSPNETTRNLGTIPDSRINPRIVPGSQTFRNLDKSKSPRQKIQK